MAVDLLGYGVACAAYHGPDSVVRLIICKLVFILEESEGYVHVFLSVLPNPILGCEGVKVCDGSVGGIYDKEGPVITIAVEGHEEPPLR